MTFDVNKIREEFPILQRKVYGKPLVYLDSGATAQKPRSVIPFLNFHFHLLICHLLAFS